MVVSLAENSVISQPSRVTACVISDVTADIAMLKAQSRRAGVPGSWRRFRRLHANHIGERKRLTSIYYSQVDSSPRHDWHIKIMFFLQVFIIFRPQFSAPTVIKIFNVSTTRARTPNCKTWVTWQSKRKNMTNCSVTAHNRTQRLLT